MNPFHLEKLLFTLLVIGVGLFSIGKVRAAEETTPAAPAAWAQIEQLRTAIHLRPDWKDREPQPSELAAFAEKARTANRELAGKAREFATRFPTNEFVGDARFFAILALCRAVAAGDTNGESEVKQFVSTTLADQSIPEDDRIAVLLAAGNLAVMKKIGMKQFTAPPGSLFAEHEAGFLASARAIIRQFPKNSKGYSSLLAIAQRAKGDEQTRLAKELIAMDGAPAAVKTLAQHVLAGTKPFQIGKPVDIRFTALDGREVDVVKLKGKVVLVDFWATDCGPCVAEMPELKAAYEKLHSKGFEIVGISLDDRESALRRFIRDKGLAWPQYFDGKGWENRFALQYGIFSIPTMWLVDRQGNLHTTSVQSDRLVHQVEALLQKRE